MFFWPGNIRVMPWLLKMPKWHFKAKISFSKKALILWIGANIFCSAVSLKFQKFLVCDFRSYSLAKTFQTAWINQILFFQKFAESYLIKHFCCFLSSVVNLWGNSWWPALQLNFSSYEKHIMGNVLCYTKIYWMQDTVIVHGKTLVSHAIFLLKDYLLFLISDNLLLSFRSLGCRQFK